MPKERDEFTPLNPAPRVPRVVDGGTLQASTFTMNTEPKPLTYEEQVISWAQARLIAQSELARLERNLEHTKQALALARKKLEEAMSAQMPAAPS